MQIESIIDQIRNTEALPSDASPEQLRQNNDVEEIREIVEPNNEEEKKESYEEAQDRIQKVNEQNAERLNEERKENQ